MVVSLPHAAATRSLGATLGRSLGAGSTILLFGELGSGKTTLVQGLGEGLGITDLIVSPTFNLINEYTEGRLPLYHFDLYRIQPSEVAALHLDSYWQDIEFPLGIVAIEWPERLSHWPPRPLQIHLSYQSGGRQAELTPVAGLHLEALASSFA